MNLTKREINILGSLLGARIQLALEGIQRCVDMRADSSFIFIEESKATESAIREDLELCRGILVKITEEYEKIKENI